MYETLEDRRLFSRTWFVAPGGLDTNVGTLAAPLQTIQAAANLAQPGDTVMIRGGTYHETVTPANSGAAAAPITYQAYNNEPVVIDGADPITGWANYSGSVYAAPQSWDLGEGNNQIFVDGQMINEARWPNTSLDLSHPVYAIAQGVTTSDVSDGWLFPSTATISDPSLPGGANAWAGATIHIGNGVDWNVQTGTVLSSAPGQITFGFQHATDYEDPAAGNHYYLTGSFQALDAPGEWYRDPNTGKLYVWTPAGDSPANHLVEARHRQYAIELSGKSYINVLGVSIVAASIDTNAASNHLTINGITAQYVSQAMMNPFPWDDHNSADPTGIQLNGTNNTLENSVIAFSSGDGVFVSGSNDLVQNNQVHDVDYGGGDESGIEVEGANQQIVGNTVYNSGRDGIVATYSTADQILNNTIHDCGLQTTDLGAIYIWGTNGAGTTIAGNTIYNMHAAIFGACGVYLDAGCSNYVVDNNTISNTDTPIKVNGPDNNIQVFNNTTSGTSSIAPSSTPANGTGGGVTDLGSLGGDRAEAQAVNDAGQVVGASTTGTSEPAFLDAGGTINNAGTLGGNYSIGYAINTAGQFVGAAYGPTGARQAFLDSSGTMTGLGTLAGDVGSFAFALNDSDTVVGQSYNAGGIGRAFVWSGGVMSPLPTLGGSVSAAFGVNDSGLIVGASTLADNRNAHAFAYANGAIADLGTLGGSSSDALAVNRAGEIVGESRVAGDGAVHAFAWQNGAMKDLGTLPGLPNSVATSINANGDIVGYAYDASHLLTQGPVEHAFVYRNGVMYDLNGIYASSGWTLLMANGINDNGQIVGAGQNPSGYGRPFSISLPATATTATASFVRTDSSTAGTWTGTYGSDGYTQFGGATQLPSYAQVSASGQQQYTWASSTTDPRALQTSAGSATRIAGTDFAANSFTLDVNLTDGKSHQVSLYLLDWDARGRAESVQVTDVGNGAVLDTRSASNFAGGQWLSWNLSGHVRITIMLTGGANAVASGLYFDPVGGATAPSAAATFVRADITTAGTWTGAYGSDGYSIFGGGNALPAYAQLAVTGQQGWTWAQTTTDPRAVQTAAGSSARLAACDYSATSFTLDLNLTDGQSHTVALYMLDDDSRGRAQTVQLTDASAGSLLDSRSVTNFAGGQWLVWTLKGHVKITIANAGGLNAVASGIFFGQPATSSSGNAATFVRADTTTEGNWPGTYGAGGYSIFDDAASLPSYAQFAVTGALQWAWAQPTTDVRALSDSPTATTRTAACDYAATSFTLDVNLTDGKAHQVALYMVDFDGLGRSQSVQVTDVATGALLDTRSVSSFGSGQWLVWNVTGHVKITIANAGGRNAVASGIFFGV